MIKNIILENVVTSILERKYKEYEIVDRNEIDINELEFLNDNNYCLVLSYDINIYNNEILNSSEYIVTDNYDQLIIVIEEDRILYLIINNNNIIKEIIIKEEELFDNMK